MAAVEQAGGKVVVLGAASAEAERPAGGAAEETAWRR